jgi:CBS domain-containing protein
LAARAALLELPLASTPPVQLERATLEFLRKHPPFNELDAAALRLVAGAAKLGYYAQGALVVGPGTGVVNTLFIVQRGVVRSRPGEARDDEITFEYGAGEMFPLNALLGARATTGLYEAAEDVFCYELGRETVEQLIASSPAFQHYCTRHMDSLLQQARAALRHSYSAETLSDRPLMRPLSSAIKRPPVTCPVDAPLRTALETMQRQRISSVVAVDAAGAPKGIFTERDLVRHTVEGRVDPARPISDYMTPQPLHLPTTATLYDAALLMARHGIRHVLVCEDDKLAGVVSERSLFALQRMSMREVVTSVDVAHDLAGLKAAAGEIRNLARGMLAQGVSAEALTSLVATLNDRLTERILALETARHDLAGIRFCWLALGSEGRHEQTFSTDQDNAILFESDGAADEARARLVPLAKAVNVTLDACGFPLCKGEIMAGNPKWCLSAAEWRARFGDWIRNPSPDALLNANIFFDFRALWGEGRLARELRDWLNGMTRADQRFLRMMAENALQSQPPLGFFGDFQTSGEGAERGTIDLKAQGTRVFTDAARIYALATGVEAQNTAERLRQSTQGRGVHDEVEAIVDAFYFILMLRLRHQHLESKDGLGGNRIKPGALNELDQRILKEALRQGRKLQKRLALDYQLR